MSGGHYEEWLRRITEADDDDGDDDNSIHGIRYTGAKPRTASERASAISGVTKDKINDGGEYITVHTKNGKEIDFTNWDDVEEFEQRQLKRTKGTLSVDITANVPNENVIDERKGPKSARQMQLIQKGLAEEEQHEDYQGMSSHSNDSSQEQPYADQDQYEFSPEQIDDFPEGGDAWQALNAGYNIKLDPSGMMVDVVDPNTGQHYDNLGNQLNESTTIRKGWEEDEEYWDASADANKYNEQMYTNDDLYADGSNESGSIPTYPENTTGSGSPSYYDNKDAPLPSAGGGGQPPPSGSQTHNAPPKPPSQPRKSSGPAAPRGQPKAEYVDPTAARFEHSREYGMQLAEQYGMPVEDGGHYVKVGGKTFGNWAKALPFIQKRGPAIARELAQREQDESQRIQDEALSKAEAESRMAVPGMASSKGYSVTQENGNVKISDMWANVMYFDSWQEAERYLMRAPKAKPMSKSVTVEKAYTPTPEEQQEHDQEDYWENQEEAEQNLEEDREYKQQQEQEEQQYTKNQQREQDRYTLQRQRDEDQRGLDWSQRTEEEKREYGAMRSQAQERWRRWIMTPPQNRQGPEPEVPPAYQAPTYVPSKMNYSDQQQTYPYISKSIQKDFDGSDTMGLDDLAADKGYSVESDESGGVVLGSPEGDLTFDDQQQAEEYLRLAPAISSEPIQKAAGDELMPMPAETPMPAEMQMPMLEPIEGMEPEAEVQSEADMDPAQAQHLWYPNPIQPPMVPPNDPQYKVAELEAKASVEAKLQELGGTMRGSVPGFALELPENYVPSKSPPFTSWQQARDWMGTEEQAQQAIVMRESRKPMSYQEWRLKRLTEGGEGSGNFDHEGRLGRVGGSSSGTNSGSQVNRKPGILSRLNKISGSNNRSNQRSTTNGQVTISSAWKRFFNKIGEKHPKMRAIGRYVPAQEVATVAILGGIASTVIPLLTKYLRAQPDDSDVYNDPDLHKILDNTEEIFGIGSVAIREGGEGSGNFDHAGRLGQVGGSAPQSGDTVSRKTSQSGEPYTSHATRRQDGEKKSRPAKSYLPKWWGGTYSGLMRQYILDGKKKPADYPKFNDLTDEQQKIVEKMIENHEPLIRSGLGPTDLLPQSVVDDILHPLAKSASEGLDFMTYDQDGRKLQEYANFVAYMLGIGARHRYGKKVAEKVAAENSDIQAYNRGQEDISSRMPSGWTNTDTGEIIPNDDKRVPKMSDAAKKFQSDEIQREQSMQHNKSWNQLTADQQKAWNDLSGEDWFKKRHTKETDGTLPWKDGQDVFGQRKKIYQRWLDRVGNLSEEEQLATLGQRKPKVVHPELAEYQSKMQDWRAHHEIESHAAKYRSPKEMPRWLAPKTPVGHYASYVFNPFSLTANVVTSLFMGYALPKLSEELKQYAKGDPRAFNPLLDWYVKRQKHTSDRIEESDATSSPAQAIDALSGTLQSEDGPVPQVIGPMLTEAILDAMAKLPDDEADLVIALMAYLGEENLQSLADKGKLLPLNENGLPLLSLKAQKALGMSDEQSERLTPIAMMIATLGGLYTAWPTISATLTEDKE